MAISVECPACDHSFAIPDEYGGRRGKCSKCGHAFTAPRAEDAPAFPEVAAPSEPDREQDRGGKGSARDDDTADVAAEPVAGLKTARRPATVAVPAPGLLREQRASKAAPPPRKRAAGEPASAAQQETSSGNNAGAAIGLAIEEPRTSDSRIRRRPVKKKTHPAVLWGGLAAVAAAVVAVIVIVVTNAGGDPETAANDPTKANQQSPGGPASLPPGANQSATTDSPLMRYRSRLVKVSPVGADGAPMPAAAGAVIDARGWIATTHQAVRGASRVELEIFYDDPKTGGIQQARFAVAGYAARRAEANVVLLQIRNPRQADWKKFLNALDGMRLDDVGNLPPEPGESLYGFLNPFNSAATLAPSQVVEVTTADRLTGAAAERLSRVAAPAASWRLIKLARPLPEHYAGGPLFDKSGALRGVYLPLGEGAAGAYAISGAHLTDLLAAATSSAGKLEPLEGAPPDSVAKNSPRSGDPAGGNPSVDDPAGSGLPALGSGKGTSAPPPDPVPEPGQTGGGAIRIPVRAVAEAREAAQAIDWNPKSERDYARLRELARVVNLAKRVEDDTAEPENVRKEYGQAGQAVLEKLAAEVWSDPARIAAVNKFAAQQKPSRDAGIYFYGKVVGTVEVNGAPAITFELIGQPGKLAVMVCNENADQFTKDSQWLVPGVILARGTLTRSDGTTVDTVVVEAKYVIEKPL